MDLYEMRLQPAPYAAIENGKKTVELRLYDEKRRKVKAGDFILFTNLQTEQSLYTQVLAVTVFQDFERLYAAYDKTSLGYAADEEANPTDMQAYYSAEDIQKFGVVAIELKKSDRMAYLEAAYQADKKRRLNNTARILKDLAQTEMTGAEREEFLKNLGENEK